MGIENKGNQRHMPPWLVRLLIATSLLVIMALGAYHLYGRELFQRPFLRGGGTEGRGHPGGPVARQADWPDPYRAIPHRRSDLSGFPLEPGSVSRSAGIGGRRSLTNLHHQRQSGDLANTSSRSRNESDRGEGCRPSTESASRHKHCPAFYQKSISQTRPSFDR